MSQMDARTFVSTCLRCMALFIGTGFVSGSIVHYPISPIRSLVIGVFGAILFAVASTVSELKEPGRNVRSIARIAGAW